MLSLSVPLVGNTSTWVMSKPVTYVRMWLVIYKSCMPAQHQKLIAFMLAAAIKKLSMQRAIKAEPLMHLCRSHIVAYRLGDRGGSVVECRTPEREVRGSRPTSAVLCPWARHFTPRKYWLIIQEAMAPSRHDWKIVDWDVKPQHNQPTYRLPHDVDQAS